TYDAMRWLDKCFAILPSYPHVRTHGFSATSAAILQRYPFNSVDSATWSLEAANGHVRGDQKRNRYRECRPIRCGRRVQSPHWAIVARSARRRDRQGSRDRQSPANSPKGSALAPLRMSRGIGRLALPLEARHSV